MPTMEDKLRKVMAEVFDVPASDINEDTSPHTIPTWDSIKHINLVLALQNEFGVRFDNEEIPTLTSFTMILNTLKAYAED